MFIELPETFYHFDKSDRKQQNKTGNDKTYRMTYATISWNVKKKRSSFPAVKHSA